MQRFLTGRMILPAGGNDGKTKDRRNLRQWPEQAFAKGDKSGKFCRTASLCALVEAQKNTSFIKVFEAC